VTATFLPTLKISPVLGRNFLDAEDRPGGNTRVLPLGDGFWRRAFGAVGRVAAGSSIDQARTELETIAARLGQQFPESNKGWGIVVNSFYDWLIPETTRTSLLVLLGAVALVLLIACVNVVNLLLARASGRQRELSIRVAMRIDDGARQPSGQRVSKLGVAPGVL
jgi:hypothetical protein